LDIHMPGMNGFEVAKMIRTEFEAPRRKVPIIALTADVLLSTREKIMKSGINDYIYKPIDYKILYAKINRFIGLNKEPLQTGIKWNFKTDHLNLDYLTGNHGDNNTYKLEVLDKSNIKLNEYTNALSKAFNDKNYEEMLFFAHRLKTIAGVLGINSIQNKLSAVHQHVTTDQPVELIAVELDAINKNTQLASQEINDLIQYISKNKLL
jgi:two-component system, sensor histidine kinase and response regulator